MNTDQFEDLLVRMPAIAKAVNSFSSEAVQLAAFEALVGSHGTPSEATDDGKAKKPSKRQGGVKRASKAPPKFNNGSASKRRSAASPTVLKDLNLRPSKGRSFREFTEEKAPRTNNEKSIVAVYYLLQVLQLEAVSTDHVFTCYRDVNWKLPSNFRNHLQSVASQKGWLDTQNMDDIKLSAGALNHVEHDLPAAPKK